MTANNAGLTGNVTLDSKLFIQFFLSAILITVSPKYLKFSLLIYELLSGRNGLKTTLVFLRYSIFTFCELYRNTGSPSEMPSIVLIAARISS